jgi:hypothetical protein
MPDYGYPVSYTIDNIADISKYASVATSTSSKVVSESLQIKSNIQTLDPFSITAQFTCSVPDLGALVANITFTVTVFFAIPCTSCGTQVIKTVEEKPVGVPATPSTQFFVPTGQGPYLGNTYFPELITKTIFTITPP